MVLDEDERLVGIVATADLERSIVAGGSERTVAEVMTTAVETTFPAETLRTAFGRFSTIRERFKKGLKRKTVRKERFGRFFSYN